ncbi:MAG TPA: hypothetical protein VFT95_19885 [Micromonosporaceae bacterium]|nr:hypothetical protein [Micromonosporaceae bacterium]
MGIRSVPALAGLVAATAVVAAELVLAAATGASARSGWTVTTQVTVDGGAARGIGTTTAPPDETPESTTGSSQPAIPSAAPTRGDPPAPAGDSVPVEHADPRPEPAPPPPPPDPEPPVPPQPEAAVASPPGEATEINTSGKNP